MPETITIVGTGQVACVVAALLAQKNRTLPEHQRVEISILGRGDDSHSFQNIKQNGITLNFCNKSDEGKDPIVIKPDELKIITCDEKEIGVQDHIFVATKSYSYSTEFFQRISQLKKLNPETGSETTVILAQNGIPCWFLPDAMKKENKRENGLDSVDPGKKLYNAIGGDNIVGCVLNFACNSSLSQDGSLGYDLYTPSSKIGMPIGKPNNKVTPNIRNSQKMFSGCGIDIALRKSGIIEDLWLKLQVNIAINALTALLNCDIGYLLDNPDLAMVVDKLATEVGTISSAVINNDLRAGINEGGRLYNRLDISRHHTTSTREDFNSGNKVELSIYKSVIEFASSLDNMGVSFDVMSEISDILECAVLNRDKGMKPDEARQSQEESLSALIERVQLSYRSTTPDSPSPTIHQRKRGGASSSPDSDHEHHDNPDLKAIKLSPDTNSQSQ